MASLWGSKELEQIVTPNEILEEQALELEKFTNNYLYGEVESYTHTDFGTFEIHCEREFSYAFMIKSKYVEEYAYKLLSIHHNLTIYPIYIILDLGIRNSIESVLEENRFRIGDGVQYPSGAIIINDKDEFTRALGIILQSDVVRNALSTLLSLAKKSSKIF